MDAEKKATQSEVASQSITECLFCGADITENTHPNAVPDFCDTRCEDAYYGEA